MQEVHKKNTLRVVLNNLELCMLHPGCEESVDETYMCIVDALSEKDDYDLICLNEIAPSDRYQRRHWLEKFSYHNIIRQ